MKITNDEQYSKSLQWLTERAKMIEHPLISAEEKAEHMRKYELVEVELLKYRGILQDEPKPVEEPKKTALDSFFD